MKETRHLSPYGNDIRLFLLLIPLINLVNYHLVYSDIHLNWFLIATFLIDTLEGYAAWWAVRSIIRYLDKKFPFSITPVKRLAIQLPSTTFAGVLVIALLTELVNFLATDEPVPLGFYTRTIFLYVIWIFVVNGIYVGLHFYFEWQRLAKAHKEEQKLEQKGLIVKSGKQDILLQFEEIAGCYVDNDYAVLSNRSDRKFFLDQSLDKLEKQLPTQQFFRLNRQYIVHRDLIAGFERADNGKINVLLNGSANLPPSITVSRLKAPGFKEWFQLSLSV
jgi:DNA-binding LytR/AlgR family response regulator